ncbi:MAG: IS1595 family transposase [Acidobacteriia bacterium]|nr:IS1595 family transposase [Terriglobia bacterium]
MAGFEVITEGSEVEIDESFIGGKARNMHASRKARMLEGKSGAFGKVGIQGILERGGTLRAFVLERPHHREGLQQRVHDNVERNTSVFTDEATHYFGLKGPFAHEFVNHAEEYVRGNVHTNTLENFWSLLKRGLHGTYVSVEPFHLFRYVDEEAFRYNTRKPMSDADRFSYLVRKIVGKRLTYAALTGKTEAGPSPDTTEVPF